MNARARRASSVLGLAGIAMLALAPAAAAGTIDNSAHYYAADGNTVDGDGGPSLTFTGTPAYTVGASGSAGDQAFSLDGSSKVVAPNATITNYGTRDFSDYLRFKTTSFTEMDIVSKRPSCGNNAFLDVRTIVYQGQGYVLAELQDAANYGFNVQVPFAFNDGSYHTVFLSRNKSSVTLNVDGTSATGTTSGTVNLDNTADLTLGGGGCSDPATTDGTARFTGAIDSAFFGVTVPPAAALPEIAYPALFALTALGVGGAAFALRRKEA